MPALGQRRDPIERFLEKVEFTDGCWLWTAKTNDRGYGKFTVEHGREVQAHRFAYETFVEPIPPGFELDHVLAAGCVNRACVHPDHLEPVTHHENLLRSDRIGRGRAGKGA